jgi:hypothetical protein
MKVTRSRLKRTYSAKFAWTRILRSRRTLPLVPNAILAPARSYNTHRQNDIDEGERWPPHRDGICCGAISPGEQIGHGITAGWARCLLRECLQQMQMSRRSARPEWRPINFLPKFNTAKSNRPQTGQITRAKNCCDSTTERTHNQANWGRCVVS